MTYKQAIACKLSYKRGCQEKKLRRPLDGAKDVVACIQPRHSARRVMGLCSKTNPVFPSGRFHDAMMFDASDSGSCASRSVG